MDPDVVIVLTSLNQKHSFGGVFSQALGQHAARAAGTDDDVVVCIILT